MLAGAGCAQETTPRRETLGRGLDDGTSAIAARRGPRPGVYRERSRRHARPAAALIEGVVDTLQVSRRLRGAKLAGGHSLKAVCERELGLTLDKTEQVSDWSQRPLSARQQAYAALDAEVLLRLYEHFGRPTDGENLDLWGTRGPL